MFYRHRLWSMAMRVRLRFMFDEIQGGRSRVRSPTAKRGEAGGAQAAQLSGSLENPLARPLIAAPILLPTPRSIVGR